MSARSRRLPALSIVRAIIYARVSQDDEGRGRSPEEQIAACTEDCEYEKWTIGAVLMDNDRGASRYSRREREQFKTLPDVLRAGDVLVVWEPSRITRDMAEFSAFCDMCADRGVCLYYDGRVWDLTDDDDRNRVWQDILDGAKQVGKTRKRVLRALTANVEGGKPHGKTPPGYRIERDPRTGRPISRKPDPQQAAILQESARRVLAGESRRSICRDLAPRWKEAGGGQFEVRSLKRFLTSPTTFGLRVHYGEIVGTGTWEPILDPDLYRPLRALLENPDNHTSRGVEPRWLLTHIAKCGVCLELNLPGKIEHNPSHGRPRYACVKYNHVGRIVERVDAHVEELLLQLAEDPHVLAKLTAVDEESGVSVDGELAVIEQLRADVALFVKDARQTRMSAQAVAAYVEPLEDEIREAEQRIKALTSAVDPMLQDFFGPDARARWKERTIVQRRDIIRRMMEITIHPVARRGRYGDLGVTVRPKFPVSK